MFFFLRKIRIQSSPREKPSTKTITLIPSKSHLQVKRHKMKKKNSFIQPFLSKTYSSKTGDTVLNMTNEVSTLTDMTCEKKQMCEETYKVTTDSGVCCGEYKTDQWTQTDGRGWGSTLEKIVQEGLSTEETAELRDIKEPARSRWKKKEGSGGEHSMQSTGQGAGSPTGEASLEPSKGICVPCARVNEKVLNYNK